MSQMVGRAIGALVGIGVIVGLSLWFMRSPTPDPAPPASDPTEEPERRATAPSPPSTAPTPAPIAEPDAPTPPPIVPQRKVPTFQPITYWAGDRFETIQMRVRPSSAPVAPLIRSGVDNPIETRRWRAVARAAWFGARVLYESEPHLQVEFHVGRTGPKPECIGPLMAATWIAFHGRAWPKDLFFAGALGPDGEIVPPARLAIIKRAAAGMEGRLVPRGSLSSLLKTNKPAPAPALPRQDLPRRETSDAANKAVLDTISRVMAGNDLEMRLPEGWQNAMQRLEGRFKATQLTGIGGWFQLAIAGSQIRAARAEVEFAAERIEPFGRRLHQRSQGRPLTDFPGELGWLAELVRARVNSEAELQRWTARLPPEASNAKRFKLDPTWVSKRVELLRELALSLRRAMRDGARGKTHPLPYPQGEISALGWSSKTTLTDSLAVDWGTWVHRSALSWAHYVATVSQQPRHASGADIAKELHGADPKALAAVLNSTQYRTEQRLSSGPVRTVSALLQSLTERPVTSTKGIRDELTLLERTYFVHMLASEGSAILGKLPAQ